MTIEDIYNEFEIMPQLREHQLRVGGVGQILAENWIGGCDNEYVTKLCLLHDMGNIVKFDLTDTTQKRDEFGKTENLLYWRQVQKKYLAKYGKDAHIATKGILKQAGLRELIEDIDEEARLYFSEAGEKKLERAGVPAVILMYADLRVKPMGIVSYQERVEDLKKRYGGGKSPKWYEWTFEFKKWISGQVKIDLTTINEQAVQERWEQLLRMKI